MDMAITIEGLPAAAGPAGPISVSTTTVTTMTQKTGAFDSQGQIESEITVDEAPSETKASTPGQPSPASVTNPIVGKKFTVVLDQHGNPPGVLGPNVILDGSRSRAETSNVPALFQWTSHALRPGRDGWPSLVKHAHH